MAGEQATLRVGIAGDHLLEVTPEMSARHVGSGDVGVLSTPSMIAMMEGSAMSSVQPHLQPGQTTVGYIVNIRHLGPTLIGEKVRVRTELIGIEGRKLRFKFEAYWGEAKVGDGEHVRAIIDVGAFLGGERS
jgi:fluoroacetyl-CoA thioesterase